MISRARQNSEEHPDVTPTPPTNTSRRRRASRCRPFARRVATATAVRAAGEDRRLGKAHLSVHMGGIAAAIDTYHTAPTPNVIMLETEGRQRHPRGPR